MGVLLTLSGGHQQGRVFDDSQLITAGVMVVGGSMSIAAVTLLADRLFQTEQERVMKAIKCEEAKLQLEENMIDLERKKLELAIQKFNHEQIIKKANAENESA